MKAMEVATSTHIDALLLASRAALPQQSGQAALKAE